MVDSDLKSYTALYLQNAQDELKTIQGLVSQENVNIQEIHRLCHTLKGQSFFMGFNDIGLKALELETYFKAKLENSQTKDLNVESVLGEIEVILASKS